MDPEDLDFDDSVSDYFFTDFEGFAQINPDVSSNFDGVLDVNVLKDLSEHRAQLIRQRATDFPFISLPPLAPPGISTGGSSCT